MILADTSIWIDYFRSGDADFSSLLMSARVLVHPCVGGEVALGGLPSQNPNMRVLLELDVAVVATDDEVLRLIQQEGVGGSGVGYVDCHLLTSTRLTPGAMLWTHDRRLYALARRLGLARPMTAH